MNMRGIVTNSPSPRSRQGDVVDLAIMIAGTLVVALAGVAAFCIVSGVIWRVLG